MVKITLGLLLVLVWGLHAYTTPWMQDEGFYLYFARLTVERGLTPFVDFAYPQGPLFPYLLGAFISWFPDPLIAGRTFSLLCMAAFLAFVSRFLLRRGVRQEFVWAGLLFIGFHPLVWDYFALVKPYAFTALLTWIAFEKVWETPRPLIAGICLGLAVSTRLNVVMAVPLVLWFFRSSPKDLLRFSLGLFVGLGPIVGFLIADFDRSAFNLFKYQTLRSGLHGLPAWKQRGSTVWAALSQGGSVLALVLAVLVARFRPFPRSAVWLVTLAVLLILPLFGLSPFYDEYLAPAYVLLVPAVCLCTGDLPRWFGTAFSVLMIGIWMVTTTTERSFLFQAGGDPRPNSMASVRKVGEAISSLTRPGDEILSFWNGYAVASDRWLPAGLESGLAVKEMAGRLPADYYRRYHIGTGAQVAEWIRKRRAPLVVIGLASPDGFEAMVAGSYHLAREVGGARLYVR